MQITFSGLAFPQALASSIHEKAARLQSAHPGVMLRRISVENRPPRQFERKRYNARLDVRLGECELVFNREHEHDAGTAVNEAFRAAEHAVAAARSKTTAA
jgi:hypothetical protein